MSELNKYIQEQQDWLDSTERLHNIGKWVLFGGVGLLILEMMIMLVLYIFELIS